MVPRRENLRLPARRHVDGLPAAALSGHLMGELICARWKLDREGNEPLGKTAVFTRSVEASYLRSFSGLHAHVRQGRARNPVGPHHNEQFARVALTSHSHLHRSASPPPQPLLRFTLRPPP